MSRATSIEVYRQIKAEGLLPKMRFKVYAALYHRGPVTAAELASSMAMSANNVATRLTELRRQGVAAELGERKCSVTGRNVILWDTTNNLPSGKITHDQKRKPRTWVLQKMVGANWRVAVAPMEIHTYIGEEVSVIEVLKDD